VALEGSGDRGRIGELRRLELLERTAVAVTPLVFEHRAADGGIGRRLQPAVDGGRDAKSFGQRCVAVQAYHLEAHHLRDVRRLELDLRPMDAADDGHRGRRVVGRRVDLAGLPHAPQHVGAAAPGALGASDRIVERRRSRQTGDQRGLRQRELAGALVEIHLRGRADAVRALAEEDPVQVERQDLFLAELALEPQREEHLLQLAPQRALGGEDGVAGELHRDRAAALAHAARRQVALGSAQQPLPVHARVPEEAIVLRREEGIDDLGRDLLPLHRDAPLLADLCDELAVARVNLQWQLHRHVA